ncbi:MAG: DUF1616 domain-containing protein [Anaerolineaceae bacterium]|nr:DUF1616 domain-containing protein [Anaerolineaceae bacterium]
MHRHNINDLHLVLLSAMMAALLLVSPLNIPILRAVVSLPFALLLPGYALTSALFPNTTLGIPERLVTAIGLSLTVLVLSGILLNYTPNGLKTNNWVIWVYGVTVVVTILALIRRSQSENATHGTPVPVFTLREGLFIAIACIMTVLALVISEKGVENQPQPGFTQLWIQPGQDSTIRVGVRNAEQHVMEYRLVIMMDGRPIADWPAIRLADGEMVDESLQIPGGDSQRRQVQAYLYTTDDPETVYRRVDLWLVGPE